MITIKRFRGIDLAVRVAGYADEIAWREALLPPTDADAFATEALYVIIDSGMKTASRVPFSIA
ncbi:hypothetical protein Q4F19_20575 [Sphingomonas sp. BIUV-7]|uniref:Uncharacterized protein n=1 Tax=Sphingomonas natans TaxID=3063330 RepID=A0ABT8YEI8_9SPHN|nr:hypothetical protein [Sphingomonas sp. BIUV-7]MDO6416791.1 hypothetical protein [Sphingomonas sp. BIUV-7]